MGKTIWGKPSIAFIIQLLRPCADSEEEMMLRILVKAWLFCTTMRMSQNHFDIFNEIQRMNIKTTILIYFDVKRRAHTLKRSPSDNGSRQSSNMSTLSV